MRPPPVIVDCPIPNRHLQMAFVEGNQEVQTFTTQAAAQSLAHRDCLGGSHRRPQNSNTQVRETLVELMSEDDRDRCPSSKMRLTTKVRVSNGSGGSVSGDLQIEICGMRRCVTSLLRPSRGSLYPLSPIC